MAEEKQSSRSSAPTTTSSTSSTETTSSTATNDTTEKNLKVELLAVSWERLSTDGAKTVARYNRGDVIEVPESVVNSLNGNEFKPAFRVLED